MMRPPIDTFWTIRSAAHFEYRPHINYGSCRPHFFRFDGVLSPAPEVEGFAVSVSPEVTDELALGYVPLAQTALAQAADAEPTDSGRLLCSIRATVTRVICHPVDTNEESVRRRCGAFVSELCRGWLTIPLARCRGDWRTGTVVGLARSVLADRAFDRLPILVDALEEAGCDDELVLQHCRMCTDHGPRCWVIDWVLDPGP